jgi:hypothetical protein
MPKVAIATETGVEASIDIVEGTSKKPGREGQKWQAISVRVGEWSTLVFPKSSFEMKYIKEQLGYE